ncbi:LysM domain protein [Metarhizium robertsii]|uniref:LysM domain protein n=1 Tax=Metarhizium robertsii TaxID=568076 RepID=A0A014P2R7_9HYPO|nr:LysM domain protein [Metarhizium robertsii]
MPMSPAVKYTVAGLCFSVLYLGEASRAGAFPALDRRANGFRLVDNGLPGFSGLGSTCRQVLQQVIKCEEYVANLGLKEYHGLVPDGVLADEVCKATCEISLTTARRRILGACSSTPELAPGYPLLALVDSIIYGWNETCLRDKSTGKYCNDILESWDSVDELDKMPETQLCSYCFGTKLRMMQQSPYSGYDELFANTLEIVNEKCGIDSPITPQRELNGINPTRPASCPSGQAHVGREGDTCDTIALANSVSAATLYFLNPGLTNCSDIAAGTQLCLPDKCNTVYQVQEGDRCVEVAVRAGTSWMKLVDWNLGLDSRCSNLWSRDPFWGRVICTSVPGGGFINTGSHSPEGGIGNGNTGGQGGSGDGYADDIVEPPKGAAVAEGTAKKCGKYVQAKDHDTCSRMVSSRAVPMDLFLQVNPSLGTAAECDSKLVDGALYCVHPFRYWNAISNT